MDNDFWPLCHVGSESQFQRVGSCLEDWVGRKIYGSNVVTRMLKDEKIVNQFWNKERLSKITPKQCLLVLCTQPLYLI